MLAVGVLVGSTTFPVSRTETTTQQIVSTTTIMGSTSTSLSSSNSTVTTQSSSITSQGCTTSYQNGVTDGEKFLENENSTLAICMRFFYYDPNITATLNALNFWSIQEENTGNGSFAIAKGEFNVSANPSSFEIGGNCDLNEGIVVTYLIQPKASLQGTWELNAATGYFIFPGLNLEDNYVFSYDYLLVVGNGVPNQSVVGGSYLQGCNDCIHVWNGTQFACPALSVCSMVVGSSNETMV